MREGGRTGEPDIESTLSVDALMLAITVAWKRSPCKMRAYVFSGINDARIEEVTRPHAGVGGRHSSHVDDDLRD
jgi:hypothetical protein